MNPDARYVGAPPNRPMSIVIVSTWAWASAGAWHRTTNIASVPIARDARPVTACRVVIVSNPLQGALNGGWRSMVRRDGTERAMRAASAASINGSSDPARQGCDEYAWHF